MTFQEIIKIAVEMLSYAASTMVLISLSMKTITSLRLFSITSNVLFILFGIFNGGPYSVLILHTVLLPLNILRLVQIKRLIRNVEEASKGDGNLKALIPFMEKKVYPSGTVLFAKGDTADKLYYIQKGTVEFSELGTHAGPSDVIGEIGVFSPFKERTATAVCQTELESYTIDEDHVKRLWYQNPKFGFALVQLIIQRLLKNYQGDRC